MNYWKKTVQDVRYFNDKEHTSVSEETAWRKPLLQNYLWDGNPGSGHVAAWLSPTVHTYLHLNVIL